MTGAGSITFIVGGLLVAVAWTLGATGLSEAYRPLAGVLAEPLALLLVVLSWRLGRSRVAIAAVLLAVTNAIVRGPLGLAAATPGTAARAAVALLLPLNLGLVALLSDHPLPRARPLIHLGTVPLQLGLVTGLLYIAGRLGWRAEAPPDWLRLAGSPQVALLAFLIAAVFCALAFAARHGSFEVAVLWVLAAAALALLGDRDVLQGALLLTAGQLTLLFAMVEDSYRLAYHDPLTGLPGRRALDEELRSLADDYAIAMVDIDHFKRFNDRFGHEVGDQALRMVADELRRVGGGGRAFRYGGEEFAILFPGGATADVVPALEQLRAALGQRSFAIRSPKRPHRRPESPLPASDPVERVTLTVSIGVAGPAPGRSDPPGVLRAADAALYRAKRRGRNRVLVEGSRGAPRATG